MKQFISVTFVQEKENFFSAEELSLLASNFLETAKKQCGANETMYDAALQFIDGLVRGSLFKVPGG